MPLTKSMVLADHIRSGKLDLLSALGQMNQEEAFQNICQDLDGEELLSVRLTCKSVRRMVRDFVHATVVGRTNMLRRFHQSWKDQSIRRSVLQTREFQSALIMRLVDNDQ